MGIEEAKSGKLIYHLTKIENLDNICKNGILSRKELIELKNNFIDIADKNILVGREKFGLDNYVPFHFHPYSAFDIAIKNKYNQEELIYLCIHRKEARLKNFKILPIHPLHSNENFNLYDYDEGFELIEWESMLKGNNDKHKKCVKMAECLAYKKVNIKDIFCIYVCSNEVKIKVEEILGNNDIDTQLLHINICKFLGTE